MKGLIEKVKSLKKQKVTLLIAIDGLGGSGKSTLAEQIKQQLQEVTIVHLDDFGYPDINRERLLNQVIFPLKSAKSAKYQRLDWGTKQLIEWNEIAPGGIVVIEGVSALHDKLNPHYDFRIWIECSAEVGFKRGLTRDKDVYKVDTTKDWINIWMPNEKKYVDEQKPHQKADYILKVDGE